MGFLDKLLSVVSEATKDIPMTQTPKSTASQTAKAPSPSPVSQELLKTGELPPKPCFTVSQEYGDKKYTFELSNDFIEFNSHSEADPSFQYEPLSDEEFTGFKNGLPIIAIAPDYNEVYAAVECFERGEDVKKLTVTKCAYPCFLFSTRFEKYGEKYYAYVFASDTARESEMLFVSYPPYVSGTALEKKLTAVLDHAAATYNEENI